MFAFSPKMRTLDTLFGRPLSLTKAAQLFEPFTFILTSEFRCGPHKPPALSSQVKRCNAHDQGNCTADFRHRDCLSVGCRCFSDLRHYFGVSSKCNYVVKTSQHR